MKSEWTFCPLGELVSFTSGGTPSKHKSEYWTGSIPWISAKTLKSERIKTSDLFISEDGLKAGSKLASCGSVLLLTRGSGLFNGVPIGLVEKDVAFNQDIKCLNSCSEVENKFIFYWLLSQRNYLMAKVGVTGIGAGKFDLDFLQKLEVPVPSAQERHQIIAIGDVLSDKIELNQKINENLQRQTIALYERLLDESNWPTATILDIAEKVAMGPFGSNIKVSTFVPEGVPIISGNHLRGYFLEESEFNYITEEHAERLKNSIVFPHDLIFTHAGNIGQVAMIPDGCKYDCYVLSQRQFYLRCDETKVVPEFLLMFFHSASGQHELLSYANQTGVPSIAQPASNLKKIPFKCPPMQEQLMWQEQVHPLLGRYLNNRLENDKLSTLRDTLLPRLMSGELDVFGLDL